MSKKIGILGLFSGLVIGLIIFFFVSGLLISPTTQPTNWRINWETRSNLKYNHQISLPTTWESQEWDIEEVANLKVVPDGIILYQGKFSGKEGFFEILIWENKSKASIRQWLTWFRHEDLILKDLPQKENFMVAGLPAFRYLQKQTSRKKPILYIFFGRQDKIYELIQEREDLVGVEATDSARFTHPVYDKILQSFRFLSP